MTTVSSILNLTLNQIQSLVTKGKELTQYLKEVIQSSTEKPPTSLVEACPPPAQLTTSPIYTD